MTLNDFFAMLYEMGGFLTIGENGDFSFDLYSFGLYATIGLITWSSAIFSLLIFYFAINHPRFNRWYHWLLFVGILSLIISISTYGITTNTFDSQGIQYGIEHLSFAILNFFFTFISSSFFTFIFRVTSLTNLSNNCSTCPFPN